MRKAVAIAAEPGLVAGRVNQHPFLDDNKRIAFAAAHTFLLVNGFDLEVQPETAYEFVMQSTSTGKFRFGPILEWSNEHSSKLSLEKWIECLPSNRGTPAFCRPGVFVCWNVLGLRAELCRRGLPALTGAALGDIVRRVTAAVARFGLVKYMIKKIRMLLHQVREFFGKPTDVRYKRSAVETLAGLLGETPRFARNDGVVSRTPGYSLHTTGMLGKRHSSWCRPSTRVAATCARNSSGQQVFDECEKSESS